MHKLLLYFSVLSITVIGGWFFYYPEKQEIEKEENEEYAGRKREYYEWLISRDPKTGKIPDDIRLQEAAWVKTHTPRKSGTLGNLILNNYFAAGPSQNGGRTRALAFDIRYNGTTNKVVLTGGVNGGIFRSEDGGLTWSFVHPPNEVRSVTCMAQDTRVGFQDTWYAGTGEANATSYWPNALVFGHGLFKSTDNGKTWTKLTSTVGTTNEFAFQSNFQFNHNIVVHPISGDVYVANHQRIYRSKDGGTTWTTVLQGTQAATNIEGVTDIVINKSGTKLFAAFSGWNPDRNIAGIWQSANGDPGSWTRIAGGRQNQTDSVAGWRAYNADAGKGSNTGWGRIVLALSANQNNLYALIENALEPEKNVSGADLFRGDVSGTNPTWSANLGQNLVAKANGTEDAWFDSQGGYCMEIACHPTINETIYIGGVSLYRSTNGFSNISTNYYMGGNRAGNVSSTYDDPDQVSHVDYHKFKFDPSNNNRMITASDGGIVITNDATASKVSWINGNAQYQTIQYYHVGIDPLPGSNTFLGGAQDNNTTFRDRSNIFGNALPDSNDHYLIVGGDGGQSYLFRNTSNQPYLLASVQEQRIYRAPLFGSGSLTEITPSNTSRDQFVTYYHLDEDNPNHIYFPSKDTLYRTTNSIGVSSSSWTRMTGVDQVLTSDIFSMATTRGTYSTNSLLFLGTADGKLYRIKDPAGSASAVVENITPPGMVAGSVVKDIAVNPRNHDTIICVVSNYNVPSIFWTGNATAASPNWQSIEGNINLPSIRSCEIITKSTGVEYYVGTTVGLFSTNTINSNSTFWSREDGQVINKSLMMNTAIIQSLAYRWKDNTMVVGTHGNGMFVTYIGNAVQLPTSLNNPIRDDKNFILSIFPTLTNNVIYYRAGNLLNIRSIQVQIWTLGGQLLLNKSAGYGSGSVDVSNFSSGTYILTISSNDGKYQFIRKFIRS